MKASLLIATLGRVAPLRELLESLHAQTYSNFEILLADQNPPGFLDALLEEFAPALPITLFRIPSQGVSQARNALLPHATGDIIAFPDDDCVYAPDTLEQVCAAFATQPQTSGLLGLWSAQGSTPPRESSKPLTRLTAFRNGGTLVQFYRRAVVEAVGSFDPLLGPGTGLPYGCGEDTDYVLRALQARFLIERAPKVRVFHPAVNLASPDLASKVRAYALGRMYLLKKHRFSLPEKLLHVLYPLVLLPVDAALKGSGVLSYRWNMFCGRLQGLCTRFEEKP